MPEAEAHAESTQETDPQKEVETETQAEEALSEEEIGSEMKAS